MNKRLRFVFLVIVLLAGATAYAPKAKACGVCLSTAGGASTSAWSAATTTITTNLKLAFKAHRQFLEKIFWGQFLEPALKDMADELSALSIFQTFVVGTYFDAEHQAQTQRVLQTIKARAHKDYHPSEGMCQFGSVSKSLSASEQKANLTALGLSQRAQSRNLGTYGTVAAPGQVADKAARIEQFKRQFCNPADNNGGLSAMCGNGAQDPEQMNRDIDYVRTVDAPWTIKVDFTDDETTDDEKAIFALASNLFGHEVVRANKDALDNPLNKSITDSQLTYMNFRSLLAKRSVAENSFNAIVAMKSSGLPGSKSYLMSVLQELGVDLNELTDTLGENPSYFAQMEILTKKLYQSPSFYTNLYDKPANVARKEVALQAIGLMQKFDLFKSHLRNEASLSVLLEMAVQKLQDAADDSAKTRAILRGDMSGG